MEKEIEKFKKDWGYYGSCTQEFHEGIDEGVKLACSIKDKELQSLQEENERLRELLENARPIWSAGSEFYQEWEEAKEQALQSEE